MSEALLALERKILGNLRRALNCGSKEEIAAARRRAREFYEALWG
jgi:hypothetical protein